MVTTDGYSVRVSFTPSSSHLGRIWKVSFPIATERMQVLTFLIRPDGRFSVKFSENMFFSLELVEKIIETFRIHRDEEQPFEVRLTVTRKEVKK